MAQAPYPPKDWSSPTRAEVEYAVAMGLPLSSPAELAAEENRIRRAHHAEH